MSLIDGAGDDDLGLNCGVSVALIALRSKTELSRRDGTVANPYSQNMTLDTMYSKGDSTGASAADFGIHSSMLALSSKEEKRREIEN